MVKNHRIIKIDTFLNVISDDEIKEGDWCLYIMDNNEIGCISPIKADKNSSTDSWYKKIIATTDPKLTKVDEVSGDNVWTSPIPQIPQSLVEYYAKYQPEEVELEYIHYTPDEDVKHVYSEIDMIKLQDNEVVWVESKIIETDVDGNEITVSVYRKDCNEHYNLSAEELIEMYDKLEEVEKLCKSAWLHGMRTEGEKFSNWKKKNL